MNRPMNSRVVLAALLLLLTAAGTLARAESAGFDAELQAIQRDWAEANYQTGPGDAQVRALETLSKRAEAFAAANPDRAEPLIWQGVVLSTYAGAKGGIGALGLAKQARAALEAALSIDPAALEGSAYTSLGALYAKVPRFPIGFGSKDKAQSYFDRALALNPDGVDSNFFYGEFLYDQRQYAAALEHLRKALRAPARPGRESADHGRRREVEALIAKVNERLAAGG